jgi:peptidoglycan hydrolase-like protein with peptidoglycan-binding domain
MKKIASVLATLGLTAGLVFMFGGSASASLPCKVGLTVTGRDGNLITVPATSGGSTWCHLQRGYSNEAVWYLQYSIVDCYRGWGEVVNIAVDGNFGPKTEAAVKWVQQHHGITADGIYGPQTRNAMLHRHADWPDQEPGCSRFQ